MLTSKGCTGMDERYWNQKMAERDYKMFCQTDCTEAKHQVSSAVTGRR